MSCTCSAMHEGPCLSPKAAARVETFEGMVGDSRVVGPLCQIAVVNDAEDSAGNTHLNPIVRLQIGEAVWDFTSARHLGIVIGLLREKAGVAWPGAAIDETPLRSAAEAGLQ